MKSQLFIVCWDDGMGMCCPMTWDRDCKGAICLACGVEKIAIFASRKDARKAIGISTRWALLQKAQGVPANDDFIGKNLKNVHIRELDLSGGEGGRS